MVPSFSNKALAAVLSVASSLAWAGPSLTGPYQLGEFGRVDVRTDDERLVAQASDASNTCGIAQGTEVLTGEFEGQVLVGAVLLCQQGTGCEPQQKYPLLAFYDEQEGVLSALLKLPAGCTSPGLREGSLLVLKAAAPGTRPVDRPDASTPAPATPTAPSTEATAGSAASIAAARQQQQQEPTPLERGRQLFVAKEYRAARDQFEGVLKKDKENPVALVGLGACLAVAGQVKDALVHLEEAARLSPRQADTQVWLAYAQFRGNNRVKAREALKKAVSLGWTIPDERAPESLAIDVLLGDGGPEFENLLTGPSRGRKRAPVREPAGSGNAGP